MPYRCDATPHRDSGYLSFSVIASDIGRARVTHFCRKMVLCTEWTHIWTRAPSLLVHDYPRSTSIQWARPPDDSYMHLYVREIQCERYSGREMKWKSLTKKKTTIFFMRLCHIYLICPYINRVLLFQVCPYEWIWKDTQNHTHIRTRSHTKYAKNLTQVHTSSCKLQPYLALQTNSVLSSASSGECYSQSCTGNRLYTYYTIIQYILRYILKIGKRKMKIV